MTDDPELLVELAADVSKALVADGTWDAVRIAVMRDGLKVEISIGWPDDEYEEEDEDG